MIAIRLLGGAKKAVGKPAVQLDLQEASVSEILQFLQGMSSSADSRILQPNNLIVAINGVDSSALAGQDTQVKSGDSVTVVTVVHGGGSKAKLYELDGYHVLIVGIKKITMQDAGGLVDRLRGDNRGISIQAASADAIYGVGHALGVLRITLEAEKRGIMLANRREAELLLRLACTDQISEALKRAGLKQGKAGCFIAFSQDADAIGRFADQIQKEFELDDSVLLPTEEKKAGLPNVAGKPSYSEFLQHLLERAAILVK